MGHHDSLAPLQALMQTWAAGARDAEITRIVQTLKDELRRRGVELRCDPERGSP
jgi:hypothetical protein